MPEVVFRTDASREIGTGHVARCLSLAMALQEIGVRAVFVCREHAGHLCDMIEGKGFEVARLPKRDDAGLGGAPPHARWIGTSWQVDASETRAALQQRRVAPDWLVVDHYGIDVRWENELLDRAARQMVIDDLDDRPHACDLLLDQNLVVETGARYADSSVQGARLLGPQFALLQPVFGQLHDCEHVTAPTVRRVFVYFGGADRHDLAGRTIEAFSRLDKAQLEVDLVVSAASEHLAANRRQLAGTANITLHTNLPSLAPLMARADICIGAAGITTWERMCLGLPSIVVTLAGNQRAVSRRLHDERMIDWLGHFDEVGPEQIALAVERFVNMPAAERAAWSRRCAKVCDGRGLGRVIGHMAERARWSLPRAHVAASQLSR